MSAQTIDKRMLKLIVGLALENELYNHRENKVLRRLYSEPDLKELKSYHRKLALSEDTRDREVSFWLEHALPQEPSSTNLSNLIIRLRQIEAILYSMLMEGTGEVQDLNDWLNYVANVGESLKDNYFMDAKILASRALESSSRALAAAMQNPVRRYELGILRNETLRIFEELKSLHPKLTIPESLLDTHLKIQASLIELLTLLREGSEVRDAKQELQYSAQKLASAQRLLLRSEKEMLRASQDIAQAQEYLGLGMSKALDYLTRIRLSRVLQQLRGLTLEAKS
ncbi:MAG: hypothetical protein QXI32_02130 [Candidatus Bathyarchaeia archaeon]